jgi:cathepsin A (carboxypeptidase C)
MRVLPTTLLIGAAAASLRPAQQVLQAPKDVEEIDDFDLGYEPLEDTYEIVSDEFYDEAPEATDSIFEPLHELKEQLKSFTSEAQEVWEDMANMFPETLDNLPFFSSPKKHTRRPDSHWDHIVRGSDVQSIWVENADGQKEREVGGKLEAYDLRVKAVDPSSLGIDPDVKQYSGYLDDNEEDKHLFYCKTFPHLQYIANR